MRQTGEESLRSRSSRRASPAALADEHRHLSLHDCVRWRERHQRMRLRHDVTHAGSGFAADQGYALASSAARNSNSRTVWCAVTHRRRCIRNRARMLIANAPRRLPSNQNSSRGCSQQWRAMHCRVTESGCWTSHRSSFFLSDTGSKPNPHAITQEHHPSSRALAGSRASTESVSLSEFPSRP